MKRVDIITELTELDKQCIEAMMSEEAPSDNWIYRDFILGLSLDINPVNNILLWRIMGYRYFDVWDWWAEKEFKYRYKIILITRAGQDLIEDDEDIELKRWLYTRMVHKIKEHIDHFWENKETILKEEVDEYLIAEYIEDFYVREQPYAGALSYQGILHRHFVSWYPDPEEWEAHW